MERQSDILLFETQQSYCTKEAFFKKKKNTLTSQETFFFYPSSSLCSAKPLM